MRDCLAVLSRPEIDNAEVVMAGNVLGFRLESPTESLDRAVHVVLAQVGNAEIVESGSHSRVEIYSAQVAANRVVEAAHSIVDGAKQVMNVRPGGIDSDRLVQLGFGFLELVLLQQLQCPLIGIGSAVLKRHAGHGLTQQNGRQQPGAGD